MSNGEQSLQDARYAPPQAHVADVDAQADGPVLATRWQRFCAVLVDGLLAAGAMWVAGKVTPWDPWKVDPNASMWAPDLVNGLLGFVIFLILHAYLLVRRGQTIGKYALGIRITRPDGSVPSLGRSVGLRYGLGYLLVLVPAVGQLVILVDSLMIFQRSKRCLHDLVADTIVVKA